MSLIPIVGLIGFLGSGLLLAGAYRLRRREPEVAQVASFVPSPEVMRRPDRDDESSMPRWRRPSLIAARATTSLSGQNPDAPPPRRRAPRKFKKGEARGPRATARFNDVSILDQPSESYGLPVGSLVAGDEVAILGRDEIWANVTTPEGKSGWVLGITLDGPKGRRAD
jgi:hypothetical protein